MELAATLVQEAADPNALIIFGATFDESLEDEIVVTVIATGFDESVMNNKSGESVRPAQKSGQSGRDRDRSDRGGRNDRNDRRAPEPMDDDDPYKEIFKIFNRER